MRETTESRRDDTISYPHSDKHCPTLPPIPKSPPYIPGKKNPVSRLYSVNASPKLAARILSSRFALIR